MLLPISELYLCDFKLGELFADAWSWYYGSPPNNKETDLVIKHLEHYIGRGCDSAELPVYVRHYIRR